MCLPEHGKDFMEELNQVQTNEVADNSEISEEGLFNDWTEDTPADDQPQDESSDSTEVSENANQNTDDSSTESDGADVPFLKIKYNKQEMDISKEEAITLSQKGMNYDNLLGKFDQLNSRLEKLAKANGLTVDSFLENIESVQDRLELDQELEQLKQQFPNTEESALEELANSRISKRKTENLRNAEAQEQKNQEAQRNEIGRQIDIFQKRYPDLEPQNLDPQVYDLMKDGYTLLEAYESVEADKRLAAEKARQSQEKISKKNESNKAKSLGNTSSIGSVEKDAFLSGFNE